MTGPRWLGLARCATLLTGCAALLIGCGGSLGQSRMAARRGAPLRAEPVAEAAYPTGVGWASPLDCAAAATDDDAQRTCESPAGRPIACAVGHAAATIGATTAWAASSDWAAATGSWRNSLKCPETATAVPMSAPRRPSDGRLALATESAVPVEAGAWLALLDWLDEAPVADAKTVAERGWGVVSRQMEALDKTLDQQHGEATSARRTRTRFVPRSGVVCTGLRTQYVDSRTSALEAQAPEPTAARSGPWSNLDAQQATGPESSVRGQFAYRVLRRDGGDFALQVYREQAVEAGLSAGQRMETSVVCHSKVMPLLRAWPEYEVTVIEDENRRRVGARHRDDTPAR